MLKYHIEENYLLNLVSGVLEKIIPNHVKDPSTSPLVQLKNLINTISTHLNL
jgi:hypothetical protein